MVNNNEKQAGAEGGAVKAGWEGLPTATKVLIGVVLAVVGMAVLSFLG